MQATMQPDGDRWAVWLRYPSRSRTVFRTVYLMTTDHEHALWVLRAVNTPAPCTYAPMMNALEARR